MFKIIDKITWHFVNIGKRKCKEYKVFFEREANLTINVK